MLRIMIVEDDALIAKDLVVALEEFGCDIVGVCPSAEEAIQIFTEKKPEFVFLDIELQGKLTGIDLAQFINRTSSVPFVFLTDHYSSESRYFRKANNTRPANYLPKGSYLPKQLWHFIETALFQFDIQINGHDERNFTVLFQESLFR